jgi:SHS family lactate transporter-like MFS transporter
MGFTKNQRDVVIAAFLGWMLDAFDFFLMVFMFKYIAADFHVEIGAVTFAVTLTLAARPIGAFIFGRLADKYGRRPALMWNIIAFSLLELASGFAPNLTILLILRALFGVAMGGEWGIGSSLTMESIPAKSRGIISGLLQAGYPTGYLVAAMVFNFYDSIGWRVMFMIGVIPALLVFYIRRNVPESPIWEHHSKQPDRLGFVATLTRDWKLAVYAILMMTAFNLFSHGSQDVYPTFLQLQHDFKPHVVAPILIVANIGAILGGLTFGALSERIGRRRSIIIAVLLALPLIPLWAFSATPVMLAVGAFLMQIAVQGAWGVIPAHLNELSPPEIRGTFPGLVYQLGNLIASVNLPIQVAIAKAHGDNYGMAMATVIGAVAVTLTILLLIGPERRGHHLGVSEPAVEPSHT